MRRKTVYNKAVYNKAACNKTVNNSAVCNNDICNGVKNERGVSRTSKVCFNLALILAAVFFLSFLGAAVTISKYVTDKNAPFGDDTHINYTVNSVFVVQSQDELFTAINQGYTYVQLDKSIENPLIVTQKAETLNSDLILDLNGIEIQRNGYDPILNVKAGVRLTIVDTSDEQTGGLYNPVGSVFNINGGTLTVVTGTFESGPRYSEYYSYNNGALQNTATSVTRRTLVEDDAKQVRYYVKDETSGVFASSGTKNAPIIRSYPVKQGEIVYNHGNLYFDSAVTKGDITIAADTYCYYRTSEDSAAGSDVSMADWYYTYFVTASDYAYAGIDTAYKNNPDYVEITIYGYEQTVQQAYEMTDSADYYAAIQMTGGVLDVQDGRFFQYFGVSKTACVNASGGEINVKKGSFSARVPNAYSYTAGATTVKESDKDAFSAAYFDNFRWNYAASGTTTSSAEDRLAAAGESYCILNGGSATVSIGEGQLYSSNNRVVSMLGGALTISGCEVTKRLTNGLADYSGTSIDQRKSAIDMQSGTLTVSTSSCTLLGDAACGILMKDGVLTVTSTDFNIGDGDKYSDQVGIYSLINSKNNFTVTDSSFSVSGDGATGIYAENGRVNVTSSSSKTITVQGDGGTGIHVLNGGSVVSDGYNYALSGDNSVGIKADGANATSGKTAANGISVANGTMTVKGNSSYGIRSEITTGAGSATDPADGKFSVKNFSVKMEDGESQTGIYSARGTVELAAATSAYISVDGNNGRGIFVTNGGSVGAENYSCELNGDNSYGILSEDGSIAFSGGSITLASNESCYGVYASSYKTSATINISLTNSSVSVGKDKTADRTDGVSASAGVFLSAANAQSLVLLDKVDLYCFEVGVVSNGGSVEMRGKGSIKTLKASAIAIRDGSVKFDSGSEYDVESHNTTAGAVTNTYGMTLPVRNASGLEAVNYVNTDGIYVNGGSFTSEGKLNLTHTGLRNAETDASGGSYDYNSLVVTSYAVRVYGGNVVISKGEITAVAGGGIYAGKRVSDGVETVGSITMGNADSSIGDITVETTGTIASTTEYEALGSRYVSDGWRSRKSITGGHAIELNGGDITVYNGTYTAQFGNGIYANGNGAITVHGGEFNGWMKPNGSTTYSNKSGPSAYYGLKVVGGATVKIYGGKYDGGNGGAFVTGVTAIQESGTAIKTSATAKVYVYKGLFGSGNLDGFNVYDDVDIVFGAYKQDELSGVSATDLQEYIVLNGQSASIAANPITQTSGNTKPSTIKIYYGTYKGVKHGMYWDQYVTTSTTYETYNTKLSTPYTVVTGGVSGEKNNTTPTYYEG